MKVDAHTNSQWIEFLIDISHQSHVMFKFGKKQLRASCVTIEINTDKWHYIVIYSGSPDMSRITRDLP